MTVERIEGAVVAVTGGGRGIGLAIAKTLARGGARVSVGDLDEGLALDAARAAGGHGAKLDVRQRASFEAFLDGTRAALGPIDVLVNNAGIMPAGPFHEEDEGLSDAQIDVNLRGVILGCKLVLPEMLARGRGHVVNVASMAGRFAVPGLAVYCATKFGVVGLTEALREEYRDRGPRFTIVTPAKITTELAAGTDVAGRGIPTATPEDVAASVLDALRHGHEEVAVPRFVGSVSTLQSLAPSWLLRRIRRSVNDHRLLEQLDTAARAAYADRIAGLVRDRGSR